MKMSKPNKSPWEEHCEKMSEELDLLNDLEKEFTVWYLIPDIIQLLNNDIEVLKANADEYYKEKQKREAMFSLTSVKMIESWKKAFEDFRELKTDELF